MKINQVLVLGALLTTSAFSATIYSSALVNADASANDRVILGESGTLLSSGYAGIGYFSALNSTQVAALATPGGIVSLTAAFTALGNDNFVKGNSDNLGSSVPGSFIINVPQTNFAAPVAGGVLYNFIGNGSTLATSTAFVLFQLAQTVAPDAPPSPPTAYTFGMNSGSLLFGTSQAFPNYSNVDLGITSTTVNAYKLAASTAVPEPSAALLGAIGALGLLRRRRN